MSSRPQDPSGSTGKPLYLSGMKKIFYLPGCSTCQKLLAEWNTTGAILRDIRNEPITKPEIDRMAHLAGGYEPLFSRRALKYRSMGLNDKKLTESDYRRYILQEDTFLKRPVVIVDDSIFIGSAKKVAESAAQALNR